MSAKRQGVIRKNRPKSLLGMCFSYVIHMVAGISLLITLGVGAVYLRLKSGPLAFPFAQEIVQRVASDALSDFDIRVGAVSLASAEQGFPVQVQLSDLQIYSKKGQRLVRLPVVRAKIDPIESILNGVSVKTIEVVDAEIRVLRDLNGRYNFLPPGDQNVDVVTPEDIFAIVNKAAENSPISGLKLISMIDTQFVYIDRSKSRVWRTSKTLLQSHREGNIISANADVVFNSHGREDTSAGLRFTYNIGDNSFDFGFKFDHASTVDLADQVSALDWLRSFDAAVTGSLKAKVFVDGSLDQLSGVLETEEGQLLGNPQSKPIKFDNGKAYFNYNKTTDTLDFTQITASSALGKVTAESQIAMSRNSSGAVDALSGAVYVTKLEVHPDGVFAKPVLFDVGRVNLHVRLSPFSLTVENGSLSVGDQRITLAGSSVAGEQHWNSSYYLWFNEILRDDLLNYWPLTVKPKTRRWMSENILEGIVKNGAGQLHSRNGKTNIDLTFDVEQGKVRYLKTLPLLEGAKGKAHLTEKTFEVALSEGFVIAPNNSRVDATGSVFYIDDLLQKPTIGDISIKATGSLQAGLSLLDEKPFEYLKKVNLKPDVAKGLVAVEAKLKVPLKKGTKVKDINIFANATITNVSDVKLVKGQKVTADTLHLNVDNDNLDLFGLVELDGLPAQTKWKMPIGKVYKGGSELVSDFTINDSNLRDFGVNFEKGTVTGSSNAQISMTLHKDHVPSYTITSDMVGLGLNIDALSWKKSKKSKGALSVNGKLGDKLTVDSLSLKAAGLSATGDIKFNDDGSFKRSDFSSLTFGNWLDASASIISTGKGRTKLAVSSGYVDLRRASFSKNSKNGPPMDIKLDRFVLSDGIVLTDLRAQLTNTNGLRGKYTARVNGGAKIDGVIFPQKNGTGADVNASDAGAVLRSANLYSKAFGGNLRLVLIPSEADGQYNGTFQIKKTRVKQDGILADLLNAISVVGLVQELAGVGMFFEQVDGQFTLKPEGVELRNTSAVGVSIGLTLDGNYNSSTKAVNFEGVLTPVYALNGTLERVFGKVFGRRKGEGLFSFVYRIKGQSSDPKISVNPLSVLAPGVVREVFRKKIPEVGKAAVPSAGDAVLPTQKEKQTYPETDQRD